MIKKRLFTLLRMQIQRRIVVLASMVALLLQGLVAAQNLVPNPSFESKTSCPTGLSILQLTGVTFWMSPTKASPDYFHVCAASSTLVSIPANFIGNQPARTGQAYAGFIGRTLPQYREYLDTPLTTPLVAGVAYTVSFYVSLADNSQWAIDKLGAYLSVGSVGPVNTIYVLSVVPQVVNPNGNFITNKSAWTLVSGTYFALGGEDHLVIGNFANDSSTTPFTGLGGQNTLSYYYIDDVSVEKAKKQGTCDLVIGKSPSKGSMPLTSGQKATFKIIVTNQGTGICAAPISVSDAFSAGLTYLSGGTSGWACPGGPIAGPNSITCTNSMPLSPGQSSMLLLTFEVMAPVPVTNCATVQNANDTTPNNNKSCLKLPVVLPKRK